MAELVDALDSGSSRDNLGGCSSHLGRSCPKVTIVANGLIQDFSKIKKLIDPTLPLIAVDGGVISCEKMGLLPDLITGDFDSAPEALLKSCPTLHTPNQNKSDLEKALDYLRKQGVKEAHVFGALGNRIDHTQNNLALLAKSALNLFFKSETETLYKLPKKAILSLPIGTSLSLIAFGGTAKKVSSTGLKWDLKNSNLTPCSPSLSNLSIEKKITVLHTSGTLFITINSP